MAAAQMEIQRADKSDRIFSGIPGPSRVDQLVGLSIPVHHVAR